MAERCTARAKSTGQQCGNPAIPGGTVCRIHGGASGHVRRAAARRVALAEALAATEAHLRLGGGTVEGATADVMLEVFRAKAWDELVLRHLVASLTAGTDRPPLVAPDEAVVWMAGSIAAPTGSTSKVWEVAPHVWVTMHQQAQRDLMAFGKMIRDAGVEEARLELDRRDVERLGAVLRGVTAAALETVLAVLGELAPGVGERVRERWVEELPGIIRREIAAVAGGSS